MHIDLAITGHFNSKTMTIKRLTIGYGNFSPVELQPLTVNHFDRHADDTAGVTWGGQTYETADAIVSGVQTLQFAAVSAGVDIQDTEVVLINFT